MAKSFVGRREGKADDGCLELDAERVKKRDAGRRRAPKQHEGRLEMEHSEPSIPRAEVADPEHAVQGGVVGPPLEQR
jgi:hypothetical protein